MALEVEVLEGRLKSFLCQLQAEHGILDRIVYKNKNQHRRCSYFQHLLKVRRNLNLLHSIHLEGLLDSCFSVITGRKAKTKAHFLESLKRKKCDRENFNFMERLLGVARLLSEMVEPILKTATEISTLLARTFFMGFSLIILALLGRLRVVVQQMLLDVVTVFNEISSLAQKKQSIKITQDGIEVFREYYPMMEEVVTLDCVWGTDKFVLVERSHKVDAIQGESSETGQSLETPIKYRSIGFSLEDEEPDLMENDAHESGLDGVSNGKRKRPESPVKLSQETNQTEQVQIPLKPVDESGNVGSIVQDIIMEDLASSSTSTAPHYNPNSSLNKKVAFVSIAMPAPTSSNGAIFRPNDFKSKMVGEKESPLFSLLSEDDPKGSVF